MTPPSALHHRRLAVQALLVALCLACSPAGEAAPADVPEAAADGTDPAGSAPPVVIELFTSEGCSSCPPADRVLAELARDPELWDRIVPLSFHVDYWNRLGWRDPFSSPRWSERQREYARAFDSDRVYTPQIVVDGRTETVGSKEREVREMIARAATRRAPVPVTLEVTPGSSPDTVRVRATAPAGREGPELFVALTESGLETRVEAGENARRTLRHDAVVRRLVPVPASGEVVLSVEPGWNRETLRVAAFAQDPTSRAIRGAALPVPVP